MARQVCFASVIQRCLVVVMLLGAIPTGVEADDADGSIGSQVADFSLKDYRGKSYSLADLDSQQLLVVAFLGTECPLTKLYGPRLAKLADEYAGRGVGFLGINANRQDSVTEIAAYARIHELKFPILKDLGNRLADALHAERTPEVFVLDPTRRIVYHGRVDDQYGVGYARDKPVREDLRTALDELLAGLPVSRPTTTAVGCLIGRVAQPNADGRVTYATEIAGILQRRCIECHRAGDIAPFSLTSFDEVVGWAETIAEVVRDQRMPPWHANPKFGHFANARQMPEEEKQLIYQWVADGAPQGDPGQTPEPPTFPVGWRLPQAPDQVIAMRDRPFEVSAEGVIEYQYFVVDPGFTEDKWVRAAEVIPGERSVVHHAIVFVRRPGKIVDDRAIGWLAAYVPGQQPVVLPPGLARRVPAGSKLVFQLHYTPTGSVRHDVTKVGLVFADPDSVTEETVTMVAVDREFEIPPQAANYDVAMTLDRFPKDAKLLAIGPHMHLRGKSFRFELSRGDASEILLDVPRYDFNWQHVYRLAEPLPLSGDIQIHCTATFDNSSDNLSNPDADVPVRWGDQTWEEMALAYLDVAIPVRDRPRSVDDKSPSESQLEQARRVAHELIVRFDKNGDGAIDKQEVGSTFAIFGFGRIDGNNDGRITLSEATDAAIASQNQQQTPRIRPVP